MAYIHSIYTIHTHTIHTRILTFRMYLLIASCAVLILTLPTTSHRPDRLALTAKTTDLGRFLQCR